MKRLLAALFAGIVLVSGCSSGNRNEARNKGIRVRTCTAGYDKRSTRREYVGIIEGDLSASVSFPVMGTVERTYVSEGQRVGKGALLAVLDPYSLTNAHSAALALLNQAEDAMGRIQMLYDSGSLAEIKYIEMQTDLEKARSAEAIARKNLADSRLVAPFSGVIGKKMVEAGENVLPNQPVFTLLKVDRVNVKIAVLEKEINSIGINQTATVGVSALDGESFMGTVTEKGIVADRVSHTYSVLVSLDNVGGSLLPGMVCNVVISSGGDGGSIVVPNRCVQVAGNGEKFVWKVSGGHAVRNNVRTGKQADGGVEITHGLSGGEEIVSEGYQKISDGMEVEAL